MNKWPRDSWSWAFFNNAPKIDNLCNNAYEVFNSRIKDARAKPIITLLEEGEAEFEHWSFTSYTVLQVRKDTEEIKKLGPDMVW